MTLGIILEIGEQDCLALEVVVRLCINAGVQTLVLKLKYWSALATAPAETSAEAKEASIIARSSSSSSTNQN